MFYPSLKSFWQSIKRDKYLLLALLLGLLLRGLNPTFGSPSLYVSNDEAVAHLAALNMIAAKTPVSIANYTPLGSYVQIPFLVGSFGLMQFFGLVHGIRDFEIFILTHPGYFLFIPRLISAFFGTLLILVVYKLTKELFKNKQVALISVFFCAVSFNLVHISHFGRPWSAALFFLLLAVYLAVKNRTLLAYLAVALSFGFHQVGILGLPLVVWICTKRFKPRAILGFVAMLALMFTFNNLTLKTGLADAISRDQSFLKAGKFAADLISGKPDLVSSFMRSIRENLSSYFIVNLLVTDGVILISGLAGLFASYRIKGALRKIIIYSGFYFIAASLFFHPLLRYLLPIFILLIPLGAYGIYRIVGKRKILISGLIAIAAVNSLWWNMLYLKTPTFIQAREWIEKNVPTKQAVGYVGGRLQTFAPDRDSILVVQTANSNYNKTLLPFLSDKSQPNVRKIIYVSNFSGKNIGDQVRTAYALYPFEYVIDYYLDPRDRLFNLDPAHFQRIKLFNPKRGGDIVGIAEPLFDATWNFPTNDSRKKVSMYSLNNAGPYVEILKVKDY